MVVDRTPALSRHHQVGQHDRKLLGVLIKELDCHLSVSSLEDPVASLDENPPCQSRHTSVIFDEQDGLTLSLLRNLYLRFLVGVASRV